MKYFNVVISRKENNEVVFDKWFDNLRDAVECHSLLSSGMDGIEYWLHIVDNNGNLVKDGK